MRWTKPPEWELDGWLNGSVEWTSLPGSPALILFFHTRCDGCVKLALPQAERMHREYAGLGVRVAGVHSAFEDEAGAGLAAFLREGNYTLPVGLDAPGESWQPRTMEAWGVEGTPTLVLLDKRSQLRMKKLGHIEDDRLRAALEQLLAE